MKIKYNWNKVGKKPTLMAMSAFYKADTDEGIGWTLTHNDMDVSGFANIIEEMVADANRNGTWSEYECRGQLEETIRKYKANGGRLPDDANQVATFFVIVFGNIRWLEMHGYLKADNYNGMQYMSISGNSNSDPNLN